MTDIPKFPKRLELELASSCNLRCTYCPRRYLDNLNGYMDFTLFKKIIDEASAYPETIIVLHRRGESLLHPRFNDIINYIAGKFKEIQLATNATLLTEEKFEAIVKGLNFISFSLDTPGNYDKTRIPARYEIVESRILKFLQFNKGRVRTQASMVKTEKTKETDVAIFKDVWRARVDRVRIYEEHSVGGVFGAMNNPRRERKTCVMPFYELLIYDSGRAGRCNHDWDGEPMGDVNANTISEIWHSQRYSSLRKEQRELKFSDAVCKDCDCWYAEIGKQGTGDVIEKS
ncbi:MAG: radical SAM protein [Candidatus Omnitrophica bacterium]|nr:radical SAM protein [Candidatus Omnitrophota bacterium]